MPERKCNRKQPEIEFKAVGKSGTCTWFECTVKDLHRGYWHRGFLYRDAAWQPEWIAYGKALRKLLPQHSFGKCSVAECKRKIKELVKDLA